jgi:hypothetical protein
MRLGLRGAVASRYTTEKESLDNSDLPSNVIDRGALWSISTTITWYQLPVSGLTFTARTGGSRGVVQRSMRCEGVLVRLRVLFLPGNGMTYYPRVKHAYTATNASHTIDTGFCSAIWVNRPVSSLCTVSTPREAVSVGCSQQPT